MVSALGSICRKELPASTWEWTGGRSGERRDVQTPNPSPLVSLSSASGKTGAPLGFSTDARSARLPSLGPKRGVHRARDPAGGERAPVWDARDRPGVGGAAARIPARGPDAALPVLQPERRADRRARG